MSSVEQTRRDQQAEPRFQVSLWLGGAAVFVLLTFLNPSATDGLGLLRRALFWLVHVALALGLLSVVQIAIGRVRFIDRLPEWGQVLLAGCLGAILFAPVALVLDGILLPPSGEADSTGLVVALGTELSQMGPPVILFWLLIHAFQRAYGWRAQEPDGVRKITEEVATTPSLRFLAQVPVSWHGELMSLSAELHYLRVRCVRGERLVLHNFGRAMDEIETTANVSGFRIHRSHWVALAHIDELVSGDGRMECRMMDGTILPVSKPNRSLLRQRFADHHKA